MHPDAGGGPDEVRGNPADANWERFLALFGIALNAISLLLILWEGSYVIALNACTVA